MSDEGLTINEIRKRRCKNSNRQKCKEFKNCVYYNIMLRTVPLPFSAKHLQADAVQTFSFCVKHLQADLVHYISLPTLFLACSTFQQWTQNLP